MNDRPGTSESARSVTFRRTVDDRDAAWVRGVVQRVGVFSSAEVDVAVELVQERLAKGPASGYHFVFAQRSGQALGYTCYGPIPATAGRYDLYWIVVEPRCQTAGVGRLLLAETEQLVRAEGGRRIYAETSGRDQYVPARAFYERCGFRREAILKDFYTDGDDKIVYAKTLTDS
jgi:ribosomal protein S18 acetylase RimI-like enzyme